ncbi:hypothetical protein ACQJBY_058790 [Aegilops geniculata]
MLSVKRPHPWALSCASSQFPPPVRASTALCRREIGRSRGPSGSDHGEPWNDDDDVDLWIDGGENRISGARGGVRLGRLRAGGGSVVCADSPEVQPLVQGPVSRDQLLPGASSSGASCTTLSSGGGGVASAGSDDGARTVELRSPVQSDNLEDADPVGFSPVRVCSPELQPLDQGPTPRTQGCLFPEDESSGASCTTFSSGAEVWRRQVPVRGRARSTRAARFSRTAPVSRLQQTPPFAWGGSAGQEAHAALMRGQQ